jgi:Ca-activated chloride channel family protein
MARAGGGAAEFIYPGERVEAKVIRQLKKALGPAVTNVKIDWGSLEVDQAPYRTPPVFSGGRVLVYGFLKREPAEPVEVLLKARRVGGDISATITLDPALAREETLIATLAARAKLRDLEEGSSALHNLKGSLQRRSSADRVKEEAVRLGVSYGLCSQWTSFVAVEKRKSPLEGDMQLRRVPIALTSGWGGIDADMGAGFGRSIFSKQFRAMSAPASMPLASMTPMLSHSATRGGERDSGGFYVGASHVKDMAGPPTGRPLDDLVRLQRADGSWNLTKELAKILGKKLRSLENVIARVVGDRDLARRAWATALAVRWLETNAAECADEWELLVKKANQWLMACPTRLANGKSWLAEAAEHIC